MSSKDRILARIRRAVPAGAVPPGAGPDAYADIPRDYLTVHGTRTAEERVDLLAANLAEYRAIVHRTDAEGLPQLLAHLLARRGAASVLVPPALPGAWLAATEATRVHDRADATAATPAALDRVDSVVTGCALAIAETGTIVLDGGPDQGRRRITLIPDHHICVIHVPGQVVDSIPQALPLLDPARPLTWISGPSATSDIELDRVEGVHGPRTLEVVLLTTGDAAQ
ncbi:lactate utilization protein C [Streptomyces venezuelae]|uniref:Lactate utilization protein C n=1 Tax=Streptomyces venezuelae TaxID=54571 RepID=A0A5P2CWD3_STRVZ|nr:LUD domain-containing protein [Streptomyces venezuelae]QES47212.1 lactate utilization protein C [Streptomyces venezuelae]